MVEICSDLITMTCQPRCCRLSREAVGLENELTMVDAPQTCIQLAFSRNGFRTLHTHQMLKSQERKGGPRIAGWI
jgi:hypothetical protein